MSRFYPHRYKVLSGEHQGLVSEGEQIGVQDYPNQFVAEKFDSHQVSAMSKAKYDQGLYEGIWLSEIQQPMYRPVPHKLGRQPNIEITEEGVSYDDIYMDLCVPFDRYGIEIKEGDVLMIASKNEVRRVEVVKIAKKPFMASYGVMNRKLTVYDDKEDQTLTINDPRATVKV